MFESIDFAGVRSKQSEDLVRGDRFAASSRSGGHVEGLVVADVKGPLYVLVTQGEDKFSVVSLSWFHGEQVLIDQSAPLGSVIYDSKLAATLDILSPGMMVISGERIGVLARYSNDPRGRIIFVDLKENSVSYGDAAISDGIRLGRWSLYSGLKEDGGRLLFENRPE